MIDQFWSKRNIETYTNIHGYLKSSLFIKKNPVSGSNNHSISQLQQSCRDVVGQTSKKHVQRFLSTFSTAEKHISAPNLTWLVGLDSTLLQRLISISHWGSSSKENIHHQPVIYVSCQTSQKISHKISSSDPIKMVIYSIVTSYFFSSCGDLWCLVRDLLGELLDFHDLFHLGEVEKHHRQLRPTGPLVDCQKKTCFDYYFTLQKKHFAFLQTVINLNESCRSRMLIPMPKKLNDETTHLRSLPASWPVPNAAWWGWCQEPALRVWPKMGDPQVTLGCSNTFFWAWFGGTPVTFSDTSNKKNRNNNNCGIWWTNIIPHGYCRPYSQFCWRMFPRSLAISYEMHRIPDHLTIASEYIRGDFKINAIHWC